MAEPGCLHDAHFQNLEVSGDVIVSGKLNHDSLEPFPSLSGGWAGLPFGTLVSTGINNIDFFKATSLRSFFAKKTSLSVDESTILFGETGAASSTATLIEAKTAPALAGDDGFATNVKPQFLTGDWNGSAFDIGSVNPFRDANAGAKSLIIFGGNTCADANPITFTLHANDGFDSAAWNVILSGQGTDIYQPEGTPAGNDGDNDLTLTPTAGCVIEAGSYLYFEWTANAKVAVKGVIKISGAALTIATAA
jgi:hypothetical protein